MESDKTSSTRCFVGRRGKFEEEIGGLKEIMNSIFKELVDANVMMTNMLGLFFFFNLKNWMYFAALTTFWFSFGDVECLWQAIQKIDRLWGKQAEGLDEADKKLPW